MIAPHDDATADLRADNAQLRAELNAALAREAALAAQLAHKDFAYEERMAHQSATNAVLAMLSASPGDPQPVFDLIVERARDLCGAYGVTVLEFDGELIHWRAATGVSDDPKVRQAVEALFPMPATTNIASGRAILNKQIVRVDDLESEPGINPIFRGITAKSLVIVPLMRGGSAIGALSTGSRERGGFSESQIGLLKTFAEQAVIAITSAETYHSLQTRTADLQESLEYQTAISDVLKVISRSTFDLQPVFQTVAAIAVRLCHADQAGIYLDQDGEYRWASGHSQLPEYERIERDVRIRPGTGTLVGRAALAGRPVHILDAWTDPFYEAKADVQIGAIHTLLGVPLLREGRTIGVIGLGRQRVEPFTARQIELVSTFADQAVIAIENARLLTEQQEALEQQTATAEVLQVINASPGNLAPVFDTLLEKAMGLCEAAFGMLYTYDGERTHLAAAKGVPEALRAFRLKHPPSMGPGGSAESLARTKRPVHVLDLTKHDVYLYGDAVNRATADLGGARTIINVPLLKEGILIGIFSIYRQEVRAFTDKQIVLLENFAAQAMIAMENARLLTEQREALERQTAMAEVLRIINASPGNLAPVFDAILDAVLRLSDSAVGSLWTYDGELIHCAVARDFADTLAPIAVKPESLTYRVIHGSEDIISQTDVRDSELYRSGEPVNVRMADEYGVRTRIIVGLRRDGKPLGVIYISRTEVKPFTDTQIALVKAFAAQAVIAMENARLFEELRQRQEELRITFENMGDGVAMFDRTQRLVAWNGRFQEIYDLPGALLTQHRTYEEYLRFLAERGDFGANIETTEQIETLVATTGAPYGYERTRPDGRVIEIRRNPVPDGGFVLIFSDITERKRSEVEIRAARDAAEAAYRDLKAAQANLIQAEKMASLGQLTAGIAHEIKNPLNFVNNFAALSVDLLDELKEIAAPAYATLDGDARTDVDALADTLTGNLRKIEEHGKRADGIVRSMLEHSRASSGERRAVDVNALVDEALNLAYHGARAQDQGFTINLQRDFSSDIPPIEVSPQDITRVLLNLFSNGFYSTTKRARSSEAGFEPQLKITTRAVADEVEIRVRDNGMGIAPDIRDKLFQPFFTTKPTGEGTGLGLSISYDIITKAHGGRITVDSKEGVFTEFAVGLPRATSGNAL